MTVDASVAPEPTVTYPVNLLLAGRPVLVVGGGRVAVRKVAGLQAAGAVVTVVAPSIDAALAGDPALTCRCRPYAAGEVAGYRLAVTCTSDPAVNAQVSADGRAAGVWVNSADDPANCDFFLPAVASRPPLLVTVSTGGTSPALASWLRRHLEQELDERYSPLLGLLADTRAELRVRAGSSEHPGWARAFDEGLVDLVAGGDQPGARLLLRRCLELP